MLRKNITIFGQPNNSLTIWKLAGISVYEQRIVNRTTTGRLFGILLLSTTKTTIVRRGAIPSRYAALDNSASSPKPLLSPSPLTDYCDLLASLKRGGRPCTCLIFSGAQIKEIKQILDKQSDQAASQEYYDGVILSRAHREHQAENADIELDPLLHRAVTRSTAIENSSKEALVKAFAAKLDELEQTNSDLPNKTYSACFWLAIPPLDSAS